MLQSKLFGKTLREAPKDEVSNNAVLLTRAGFIDKLTAGVYTYLPLGLRVLNKIKQIVREEMDAIDGQEILMPALQPKEI
jgi:prolyl-tRNA synthetase